MILQTVTITGASDDTDIERLIDLSGEFPFVEWGILISKTQEACGRFPSRKWMEKFSVASTDHRLRVSTHLCGQWVRSLLLGRLNWAEVPSIYEISERVQINTHGRSSEWSPDMINNFSTLANKQVIFQWDQVNNALPYVTYASEIKTAILFDSSGGAGILPADWPAPKRPFLCGYAGGLGPENVAEQLQKIASVCNRPFWIDMERRVRSDDDNILDMEKVERVLKICEPHVS